MAVNARFIGIDTHLDPSAGDLVGAVRDATALWALFTDTLPTIDSDLLTNQQATIANIRCAVLDTLATATEDDDIIITFAGHGTHNHRIVAYDTRGGQLDATSLGMDELAEAFKKSRANSVLCILDCCFSGHAPARILEDTPASRAIGLPQDFISGKGRVLFAASDFNEPAYEHPKHRHGLLTYALIQGLCSSEPQRDLNVIVAEATDLVRALAGAMGVRQTPVAFNLSSGGIKIASLQSGFRYQAAFPDKVGIRIGNDFAELAKFGIPTHIIEAWKQKFPNGLNHLQMSAVNDYRILDDESLLVVAPTSSGKTFIGELAGAKAITEGRKAVYVFPYKALVSEKYEDFISLYQGKLGLRVIRCTGDYLDQTKEFLRGKFDIAVLTYEMFLSLTVSEETPLHRLGLLVVDEAQFIAESSRGIVVELLLTRIKMLQHQGVDPQIILLSATIGDVNKLNEWLGVKALITQDRPVPLEMGVLNRHGVFEHIDKAGNRKTEQLLLPHEIMQRGQKASSQDVLVPLVRKLLSDKEKQEKVLVFRNRRGPARGCAEYLAKELGLPPAPQVIDALPSDDPSGASSAIRRTLLGGVAFHTADLKPGERSVIEQAFRDPDSPVRVLVATTTVAAGINTPASTVIVVEHEFPWENKPFTVAEAHNMAGRAGRLGYREAGRAIFLADTPHEHTLLYNKYVQGKPEAITSSFSGSELGTWILRLLTQVKEIPETDIPLLLAHTYGGFLLSLLDPNWHTSVQADVNRWIARMIDAELIEKTDDHVCLTLLGRECGLSSLSLESSIRFIQLLQHFPGDLRDALKFASLLQVLPEIDALYTPVFKKGQRDMVWPQELGRMYPDVVKAMQHRADDTWQYAARAKRACIIRDWANGTPAEQMEEAYTTNSFTASVGLGDIRRITDLTRFHLKPAYQIANIVAPGNVPSPDELENLLLQLEIGLPLQSIDLLSLPFTLLRGEYLTLSNSGIYTTQDFIDLPLGELERLFGQLRAHELDLLRTRVVV